MSANVPKSSLWLGGAGFLLVNLAALLHFTMEVSVSLLRVLVVGGVLLLGSALWLLSRTPES